MKKLWFLTLGIVLVVGSGIVFEGDSQSAEFFKRGLSRRDAVARHADADFGPGHGAPAA